MTKLTFKQRLPWLITGYLIIVYLAVLIAPCMDAGNIFLISDEINYAMAHPFSLSWCINTPKTIGVLSLIYVLGITYYEVERKNYRRGEEYGSASWTSPYEINRKIADKNFYENKILSEKVGISYNTKNRKHMFNLNTIIVGGSGSGKTRFFVKPNLMQCNTSYVVLDPKGENLASTGTMLKKNGYEIKVLNLIDMVHSDHYNPFVYLTDDNSVQTMVTNVFKSTDGKGAKGEAFWDESAKNLLSALCYFVIYMCPEEEQNFSTIMLLLRKARVKEDNDDFMSPVDQIFADLAYEQPNHIAVKYWNSYKVGSGKTLKSIQAVLASRLQKFNLLSLERLTSYDDLKLGEMGDKKIALFIIIPDMDTSFNFLAAILYSQLFQQLEAAADKSPGQHLKIPVHFLMDEFANVALPDDFEKILSVIRSRWISVSIILQNVSQLKALFEKQWESIIGNCDTFVYLGGNEQSTHEYIAKKLGKETIDTTTSGRQRGSKGSSSVNYNNTGRELLTSDEVANIDAGEEIVFVRGRAFIDKKYPIESHPRYSSLSDNGNANAYVHEPTLPETNKLLKARGIEFAVLPQGCTLMTAEEARKLYPNKPIISLDNEVNLLSEQAHERSFENREIQTKQKGTQNERSFSNENKQRKESQKGIRGFIRADTYAHRSNNSGGSGR